MNSQQKHSDDAYSPKNYYSNPELLKEWRAIVAHAWSQPEFLAQLRTDPGKALRVLHDSVDNPIKLPLVLRWGIVFPLPYRDELEGLDGLSEEQLAAIASNSAIFGLMDIPKLPIGNPLQKEWGLVIGHAWTDDSFMEALRQDPRSAINQFGENGKIPNLMQSDAHVFPIGDCPKGCQDLSEDQLHEVAGDVGIFGIIPFC